MAAVAPPLSVNDQPQRCIEQLLSIITQRDAEIELLHTNLQDQAQRCKLQAYRAARAEADAAAAQNQLLHATRQLPPPPPPSLSPADLAALNALGPAERDAAWLRRVFVRGDARPPFGPYEVAGLYVDAFFWSGTAARPDAVVAAVARVFPGVELVPTECGPRFRGLARAQQQVAPPVARFTGIGRTIPSGPAARPPPPSSCPTSSPASSPYPTAASTAKRRDPPEPTLESASKRVRSAHTAPAPAPIVKCEAAQDAVLLTTAAVTPQSIEERPLAPLQWFGSATMQPSIARNSHDDAYTGEPMVHPDLDSESPPIHVPRFAHSGQRVHLAPDRAFAPLQEGMGAGGWL